jgi:hypothetical protein
MRPRYSFTHAILSACVLACALQTGLNAGVDQTPGQTGNEPHNAVVNPRNPAQVAVMQGCQIRISLNYGLTFPIVRNSTVSPCNGDPSMAFDSQGRLFVTHISRQPEQTIFAGQIADTTTANTQNYTPIAVSLFDGIADDKQWIVADANPSSPYVDNLYLAYVRLGNPWRVMFTRSTNQGASWSAPQVISGAGEGNTWPVHTAVGPNGDVYVSYHTDTCGAVGAGTVELIRDGFGGQNLAAGVVLQKTQPFGTGQATLTCNEQDVDPEIPGTDFWTIGAMQAWVLPDPVRAGNVYVVANDDPNDVAGNGDDGDVVIARSTDFGATFTRSRVDHGPGQSLAVFPTAHIDQDGNIVATWYDNRSGQTNGGTGPNGNDNFLLELYGTTSKDGGATFSNDFLISDSPFDPDVSAPCRFGNNTNCGSVTASAELTLRIGEYNGLWSVDGLGYATWTGNATPPPGASGAQTIYFDLFSMLGAFPDQFEPNEAIESAVVATLGSDDTYHQRRLTLHSATDVDFFQVMALASGKLEITLAFNERVADLLVRARDSDGTVVATGSPTTVRTGNTIEFVTLPVVQGHSYFIEVLEPAPLSTPYQTTYDLTVVNRAAPVPFGLDLVASSDSGLSSSDNVTNDSTPTVRVNLDSLAAVNVALLDNAAVAAGTPGYAVAVYRDGNLAGYADPVGDTNETIWQFTFSIPLADGARSITTRVHVLDPATPQATGVGGPSGSMLVTIDTTAPAAPGAPDLLASSDTGGIVDDNITTLTTPKFAGSGEANTWVHIFASGVLVGQGVMTTQGTYEITVNPLNDGVYDVTARLEDLAGNMSAPSAALKVTIANQSLTLPGTTASGPAAGAVAVDLADGAVAGAPPTIAGYPGIAGATGKIGIAGIPGVTFDLSGQALSITGTPGDDGLIYRPTGAQAGTLTRAGSSQTLNFSSVGNFVLDPVAGSDTAMVLGTSAADVVTASLNVSSTLQVNALLAVSVPTANAERLLIDAGQGTDSITATAFDSVNANLFVDGNDPTANPQNGDQLTVASGSPKAKFQQLPGGATPGSGGVLVTYPQTTGNQTRIDYSNIEKLKIQH